MPERNLNPEHLDQYRLATAVKDFVYSFRFSQGDGTLQEKLFKGLMAHYDPDMLQFLRSNRGLILKRFSSLGLPGTHISTKQDVPGEFKKQAETYLTELTVSGNPQSPRRMYPSEKVFVAFRTIDRDFVYQSKNRNYGSHDQHASYFREYMLGAAPTGSSTYDAMFQDVTSSLLKGNISLGEYEYERLVKMSVLWEQNHPGEDFMPKNLRD